MRAEQCLEGIGVACGFAWIRTNGTASPAECADLLAAASGRGRSLATAPSTCCRFTREMRGARCVNSFKDVCRPQYAAFVERLAGALGWPTEPPTCEALGECFEEFEDELYVRGTGRTCRLPRVDAPQTPLDALFDARLEFDTIRTGLLEFQGRELFAVKETVRELLGGDFAEVAVLPELMRFATALEALEVGHTAGDDAPVWFWDAFEPIYLRALTSGAVVNGWHTAYWLSFDELLAIATYAGRAGANTLSWSQFRVRRCTAW